MTLAIRTYVATSTGVDVACRDCTDLFGFFGRPSDDASTAERERIAAFRWASEHAVEFGHHVVIVREVVTHIEPEAPRATPR